MAQFTKRAILASVVNLLNQRPLHKITVKDVVADCGINRNTFYYHFPDIHAAVAEVFSGEVDKVMSHHSNTDSWEDRLIEAAEFALANRKAIYHVYHSVDREALETYMNTIARDVMRKFVEKSAERIPALPEDKALLADFYRSALVGMLLSWVAGGMAEDPETRVRRLGYLLEGSIARSLERSLKSDRPSDT